MSARIYHEPPAWLVAREWPAGSREARSRVAWDLRMQGRTGIEIAAILKVKRAAAYDLLSDPDGSRATARRGKRTGRCLDCGTATCNGGAKPPERCLKCSKERTRSDMAYRFSKTNGPRKKWSDEQIFAAIRSVASDGRASSDEYLRTYKAAPSGSMPSMPLICRRFDGWSVAVQRAGLLTKSGRGGAYASRLTKEMLMLALEDCAAEVGRPPTYSEYEDWARRTGSPSAQVIRIRFGSWNDGIRSLVESGAAA